MGHSPSRWRVPWKDLPRQLVTTLAPGLTEASRGNVPKPLDLWKETDPLASLGRFSHLALKRELAQSEKIPESVMPHITPPKAPKKPAAPPTPLDSGELDARIRERARRANAYGRRSTILTGPGGTSTPATLGYPAVLGG